ncbi:MAG TPA: F0F1 ATP synthase subunit A [Anaerolineae bacterium]|nr:F0F1 ATP synthase subunit A [Anaerolineae bacterium]
MKKRYIIYACLLAMLGVWATVPPVLPVIQLPGEVVIKLRDTPLEFLGGITNTFIATVITYVIITLLVLFLRSQMVGPHEAPKGKFYNFFEMIIEMAYGFVENAAGKWTPQFFPFFMTFILLIIVANWLELVPGVDSVGIWEHWPHFKAITAEYAAEDALEAGQTPMEVLNAVPLPADVRAQIKEEAHIDEDMERFADDDDIEHFLHLIEEKVYYDVDRRNEKDVRRTLFFRDVKDEETGYSTGPWLLRSPVEVNEESGEEVKPPDADWTIVPFIRVSATDLNFTFALAIISVVMTQYYGFKALGLGYLSKFFTYNADGIAKNPLGLMDTLVGLIEFVSEIAKILSFAFRLFGNIFAGQVLLFVIGFLAPVALVAVYGLEFFVGAIQAMVFAMLSLTFMSGATVSHHHDDDEHH